MSLTIRSRLGALPILPSRLGEPIESPRSGKIAPLSQAEEDPHVERILRGLDSKDKNVVAVAIDALTAFLEKSSPGEMDAVAELFIPRLIRLKSINVENAEAPLKTISEKIPARAASIIADRFIRTDFTKDQVPALCVALNEIYQMALRDLYSEVPGRKTILLRIASEVTPKILEVAAKTVRPGDPPRDIAAKTLGALALAQPLSAEQVLPYLDVDFWPADKNSWLVDLVPVRDFSTWQTLATQSEEDLHLLAGAGAGAAASFLANPDLIQLGPLVLILHDGHFQEQQFAAASLRYIFHQAPESLMTEMVPRVTPLLRSILAQGNDRARGLAADALFEMESQSTLPLDVEFYFQFVDDPNQKVAESLTKILSLRADLWLKKPGFEESSRALTALLEKLEPNSTSTPHEVNIRILKEISNLWRFFAYQVGLGKMQHADLLKSTFGQLAVFIDSERSLLPKNRAQEILVIEVTEKSYRNLGIVFLTVANDPRETVRLAAIPKLQQIAEFASAKIARDEEYIRGREKLKIGNINQKEDYERVEDNKKFLRSIEEVLETLSHDSSKRVREAAKSAERALDKR